MGEAWMRSLANTTVQLVSASNQDEYGDVVAGELIGNPFPVSLIERRQLVADPSDNTTPTYVRYAVMRCRSNIEIEVDQILTDLKTNKKWAVDEVTQLFNPMTGMDLRCQLRRVSS